MTATRATAACRLKFHPDAEAFLFAALQYAQSHRSPAATRDDEATELISHVTGQELLEAIRVTGLAQYGLLARFVFAHWGITTTDDFGKLVFGLVEAGRMHKTDQDRLSDFLDVYRFDAALDRDYAIDTRAAFGR